MTESLTSSNSEACLECYEKHSEDKCPSDYDVDTMTIEELREKVRELEVRVFTASLPYYLEAQSTKEILANINQDHINLHKLPAYIQDKIRGRNGNLYSLVIDEKPSLTLDEILMQLKYAASNSEAEGLPQ